MHAAQEAGIRPQIERFGSRLFLPFFRCAWKLFIRKDFWLRGVDLNHRPLGYEFNSRVLEVLLGSCSSLRAWLIRTSTKQHETPKSERNGRSSVEGILLLDDPKHAVRQPSFCEIARSLGVGEGTVRRVLQAPSGVSVACQNPSPEEV